MRSHLHQQVNRKVSHFIMGEEGKVGSRSAFTAAAFIGATSLAGMLLSVSNADVEGNCGGGADCNPDTQLCCYCYDQAANQGYNNCHQDTYGCAGKNDELGPGISCWSL